MGRIITHSLLSAGTYSAGENLHTWPQINASTTSAPTLETGGLKLFPFLQHRWAAKCTKACGKNVSSIPLINPTWKRLVFPKHRERLMAAFPFRWSGGMFTFLRLDDISTFWFPIRADLMPFTNNHSAPAGRDAQCFPSTSCQRAEGRGNNNI